MPLKVRLQISFALFVLASAEILLGIWHLWAAVGLGVLALIYIDMIYHRWNLFGPKMIKDLATNEVALTFDDGPSPWTLPILQTLRERNIRATFFLLGKAIERYPEIARQIKAEGHTIGYHGYAHKKYHFKGPAFIRNDLDRCDEAFQRAGVSPAKLIRFPHGFKNIFALFEAKRRGLKVCSWSRGIWDSKVPGVELLVERGSQLKGGEILLLHDGDGNSDLEANRKQTSEALPKILDTLRERHPEFKWTTLKPDQ